MPIVAILCIAPRSRASASAIALALARATGSSCALAGAVGGHATGALPAWPMASRTAALLRSRDLPAQARGRLVWLADRRPAEDPTDDVAARAAAMSAELGRAAAAAGTPAVIALPFARSEALDRVLAWHDAIVIVREPSASAAMHERALASLTALGRPVAAMAPPPRLPSVLAVAGLHVPEEAVRALAGLTLGERDDG